MSSLCLSNALNQADEVAIMSMQLANAYTWVEVTMVLQKWDIPINADNFIHIAAAPPTQEATPNKRTNLDFFC